MKKGFTLSEVLITLGIIGVVAAITLPILIQNYKKHVWVNQLKSSVSILENGFKMVLAREGVEKLTDTSVWILNYPTFYNNLNGYFKMTMLPISPNPNILPPENSNRTIKFLNNNSSARFPLELALYNGAHMYISGGSQENSNGFLGSTGGWNIAQIIIDVNGFKLPNQFGRDVFVLLLQNNGSIVPYGSVKSLMEYCEKTTTSESQLNGCKEAMMNMYTWEKGNGSCTSTGSGITCASRIMEESWKMNY